MPQCRHGVDVACGPDVLFVGVAVGAGALDFGDLPAGVVVVVICHVRVARNGSCDAPAQGVVCVSVTRGQYV